LKGAKPMTESDWITATNPQEMLRACGTPSDRKLRLFAVACVRRVEHLIRNTSLREFIGVAESVADGLVPASSTATLSRTVGSAVQNIKSSDLRAAAKAAVSAIDQSAWAAAVMTAMNASLATALRPTHLGHGPENHFQCKLLRDIVANPFVAPPRIDPAWLAWNYGTIPKLAEAAYLERSLPSGELDRHRLAVLADALEEVGADDLLLGHLRGPGPHVRGDWVVDLLTGRE
jgi:hypothetical protein